MLVKTDSIEFSRPEYFTAYQDDGQFLVIAYRKVVAIVGTDGKVYKRLKYCTGSLDLQVDLSLQKVSGKQGEVSELSETEWKTFTGEI